MLNCFIENKGQFIDNVYFFARLSDFSISFSKSKVTYCARNEEFSIEFLNANNIQPEGRSYLKSSSNFYFADVHYDSIQHCTEIIYENLYPGISLIYRFTTNGLKYDFIVEPFADISQISMEFKNLDDLVVDKNQLQMSFVDLIIFDESLEAWYDDTCEPLAIRFTEDYSSSDKQIVNFTPEINYDNSKRIIIDPLICSFSTYLGGSEHDQAFGVVVDSNNEVIIGGYTWSSNFPTYNAMQAARSGSNDMFICKFQVRIDLPDITPTTELEIANYTLLAVMNVITFIIVSNRKKKQKLHLKN